MLQNNKPPASRFSNPTINRTAGFSPRDATNGNYTCRSRRRRPRGVTIVLNPCGTGEIARAEARGSEEGHVRQSRAQGHVRQSRARGSVERCAVFSPPPIAAVIPRTDNRSSGERLAKSVKFAENSGPADRLTAGPLPWHCQPALPGPLPYGRGSEGRFLPARFGNGVSSKRSKAMYAGYSADTAIAADVRRGAQRFR